jgi:hypothetical protein
VIIIDAWIQREEDTVLNRETLPMRISFRDSERSEGAISVYLDHEGEPATPNAIA